MHDHLPLPGLLKVLVIAQAPRVQDGSVGKILVEERVEGIVTGRSHWSIRWNLRWTAI